MEITKLYTEYQEHPIGMDEAVPRFSWELASEQASVFQSAYRVRVRRDQKDEDDENDERNGLVWDSGKVASNRSLGIAYDGPALQACTRYCVYVQVWNQTGEEAEAEDWFETGLMNPDISAWEGAQWIAAPRYTVAARTRGVFGVTSEFRMAKGAKRAGIVFGEGDYRLLDGMLNEYGVAGENYIRYEVNIEDMSAPRLDIYRVGYAPEDEKDKPFASVLLQDVRTGELLMNEENREQFHTLCVKVMGNRAQAYFDGVLVDAGQQERQLVDAGRQEGQLMDAGRPKGQEPDRNGVRTLNPRGMNDVLTYPRLNRIGFFAGKEGKVYFRNYTVSNLRKPQGVFIEEKAGESLYGKESIFKDVLPVEQECFVVKDAQVTADPSNTSLPMFRREFQVKDGLKGARLYITSRGIYDCGINGIAVNNSLLAPGLTQYDRRLNYQTYDITDILREGANGIGVILASGWWSDAQTYIVSNYNYFGDREAVLCKLVLVMDYMRDKGMPGKGDEEAAGPLADWLAFEETDAWLMWNAFYYREAVLMEKMARVIGCAEEAQEYALLHKRIRDFWNRTFIEQETGRTRTIDGELCDTQCSYALALAYGIADDAERMAGHLARKVRENGYRVGTGFFGTGLLNKALSRNGYKKEAWKLLLQTEFPSWLYPVTQGATTIWEHWDSYTKERGFGEYNAMNSFNHYSLGSVLSWVYEDILGIQRQEEYPGYTHFLLKPDVGELESAYGSVASPFGKIESGFRKEKGKIRYSCRIPANASATLTLPDGTEWELGMNLTTAFNILSASRCMKGGFLLK